MKTQLRKSIDATFYNGLLDAVIKSLTTGPLLTAYAVSLGIGNVLLGFLQSVVPFSNLLHLGVSYVLEKGKSPKKIACISSLLSRPFLALLALAFFLKGNFIGIALFVFSYTLFYSLVAWTGGAFWPWCKAFVPRTLTTSFFAHRMRYILLTRILTVTLATTLLSFMKENYSSQDFLYPLFLSVAFVTGLFYTYTLFQMHDVKLRNETEVPFLKKIHFAFKNKGFSRFFFKISFANFVLSFFTPFSIVFLLKDLNLAVPVSLFFSIGSSCVDILFIGFWKKYAYQKNLAAILFYAAFFFVAAIMFLIYVSFFKIYVYPCLVVAFILMGIGSSGMNLAISDSSISYVPAKMSSVYISLINVGRFVFSGMGSFCAGLCLETVGYYTFHKWTFFFSVCAILFISSGFLCRKIKPSLDILDS